MSSTFHDEKGKSVLGRMYCFFLVKGRSVGIDTNTEECQKGTTGWREQGTDWGLWFFKTGLSIVLAWIQPAKPSSSGLRTSQRGWEFDGGARSRCDVLLKSGVLTPGWDVCWQWEARNSCVNPHGQHCHSPMLLPWLHLDLVYEESCSPDSAQGRKGTECFDTPAL